MTATGRPDGPDRSAAPGPTLAPEAFESTDVGEVEAFVSRVYSRMRIGAVGEETRASIHRRVLGAAVGFDDLTYSFDIEYAADPPDVLIICDVVANTIDAGTGGPVDGPTDTFGPGDQFAISRPGLPYAGTAHESVLRFTLLDPALLTLVAGRFDDPAGPVRLLDHHPFPTGHHLDLRRAISYVRDDVLAGPPPTPLVASTAAQFLAAQVLQAYPSTAAPDATPVDRRDATPVALRLALAFIDAHADLDIGIADIAQAAHVTPRAVQLAFRRHLDTTPTAHLRLARLHRAHSDMLAADPATTTVTRIAATWGFADPSRFAVQYRAAYGRPPSQALHA